MIFWKNTKPLYMGILLPCLLGLGLQAQAIAGEKQEEQTDQQRSTLAVSEGALAAALSLVLYAEPAVDTDGDGVIDAQDNCLITENPDQLDTDGDGYGNRCDADFNQDCVVNFIDLGLFRSAFFGSDPLYDLDGNGVVNFIDLGLFRSAFFMAPGPSATTSICE